MRLVIKLLAYIVLVAVFFFPQEEAKAWELESMNATINTTNFIVDDRCSGTLIDLEQRLILTNWHCVRHKISRVSEEVIGNDGEIRKVQRIVYRPVSVSQKAYANFEEVSAASYVTEIVAQNETEDLALLQIKSGNIPHTFSTQLLPEGTHIIRGETVFAVGNPSLLDASVTDGIVSNLARKIRVAGVERAYMQMSSPIFGGNSGGALYNEAGQMIGIPAAAAAGGGSLAFAIRIDTIRNFLRRNCFAFAFDYEAADADMECRRAREENGTPSAAPASVEPTEAQMCRAVRSNEIVPLMWINLCGQETE